MFSFQVHHKKILLIFLLAFSYCLECFSQRYNFEQYDIENGLAQSQVNSIVQDGKRRLWIATLAGISCFNGKQFTNYSKTDGINSNFTLSLAINKQNELWIGSAKGLTKYNGNTFFSYKDTKSWVGKLTADKAGHILALKSRRIYQVNGQTEELVSLTKDTAEIVTALRTDYSGKVWAAVYQHGLYYFENNKWHKGSLNERTSALLITDILIDQFNKGKIWLLTTEGIHVLKDKSISKVLTKIKTKCTSIIQDNNANIWIGTTNGAYFITAKDIVHFNSKNGFTDNIVNDIYEDAEDNIWLGTDGAGLFKFRNDNYVTFDETQGLQNKIIMSIANGPTNGEIWMGSYGGLYKYKNKQIKPIVIPSKHEESQLINFLFNDSKGNIWIGTPGGGLWMHNSKGMIQVDAGFTNLAYNTIMEDSKGKIWLSTNYGCLIYDGQTKKLKRITKQFGGSLLEIGKDSVITGTQDGAWLITKEKNTSPLNIKAINGASILCMLKVREYILFGTADYGLYIWNSKTKKGTTINTKHGLAADHVYSILKDKTGTIWIGTGKGINKLNSIDFTLIKNSEDSRLTVECNQNAIFETNENIWIGTTKGAIVYNIEPAEKEKNKPYIFINSVKVLRESKQGAAQDTSSITFNELQLNKLITLPYSHHQIIINYTGIYLTDPGSVRYKYRLIGLDAKYSEPASNSSMNFTSVPPGKYTFEVTAITRDGVRSLNTASFSFEIQPPYYQTNFFRFIIFFLVMLLIVFIVYAILIINERRRKLRLKIKLEEQLNVRKQTAEDFHDDLGNKLTRITVLSEVLSSMIDIEDTEKRNILKKINNNVNELYTGTKDILWSLNPKHDTLDQLLEHIQEFGQEMFNETHVQFKYDIEIGSNDTKLALDMSRNILMIFKESIHNVLKHAQADQVHFKASLKDNRLKLSLQDNGQGFNPYHIKNGNGMNNMRLRAARIKADFKVTSNQKGTNIALDVNFLTLKHFKNV